MKKSKKLLSLLLSAAMVGTLAGCGSAEPSDASADTGSSMAAESSSQAGSEAAAGTEKGDIVFGLGSTWANLLPIDLGSTYAAIVVDMLFEPLTMNANTDGSMYRAAESIDCTNDNKTLVFHLNQGCTWSDGVPCTAEDWVWTIETLTDPEFGTYMRTAALNVITGTDATGFVAEGETLGVRLVDDYTFELDFKDTTSVDLFALGSLVSYLRAMPKHCFEDTPISEIGTSAFWSAPVSNGCCTFDSEPVPGQEIVLKARPDYYLGEPGFETVTFTVVDEANASNALMSGEIDTFYPTLSDEVLTQLDGYNGIYLSESTTSRALMMLYINNEKWNTNVRKAIDLLIDKQALVDAMTNGKGTPKGDPLFVGHEYSLDYDWAIDVEGAKALLDEVGFDYENTVLTLGTTEARQNMAMIIQQSCAAAGVKIDITLGESTAIFTAMRGGELDLCITGWVEKPHPASQMTNYVPMSNMSVRSEDDTVMNYMIDIVYSDDEAEKKRLYQEMQQYMRDTCQIIGLYSKPTLLPMSAHVSGIGDANAVQPYTWTSTK